MDLETRRLEEERLERARAELVKKYRDSPRLWPDGIDTKYDRWYSGHEWEWTEERIAKALAVRPVRVSQSNEGEEKSNNLSNIESNKSNKLDIALDTPIEAKPAVFDKRVYQREYMRKKRAKNPK